MPLSWAIPLGTSLLGGLLGSEEKTVGKTNPTSQTTTSSNSSGSHRQDYLDPRMEQAIYGAGGIMPNAAAWYAQNQSGLNDKMVTGMNNQWNQLGASTQGFNQMQNLGMGLMGGGTAGNPFTGGGGIAPQQMSYKPANFNTGGGESPFAMPAAQAPAPSMSAGGGGSGGGGGDFNSSDPWAGVTAPAATPNTGAGSWFTDEGGDRFWMPAGDGFSNGSPSGGYSNPYTKPRGYSFNNGYAAYGADGSSASNPSGGE